MDTDNHTIPECLGIIAGRGAYPLLLAQSARTQGVKRLVVVAYQKETEPDIERYADEVHWLNFGQLTATLDTFRNAGVTWAVMAGQITPTHLFRLRPDARALSLLAKLKVRNAHTLFGAVSDELLSVGVTLLPACRFMEETMPLPGTLSARALTERESDDVQLGLHVAKTTSGLDIGQTVVIKEGVVLAVEAFEGTDATLLRAGELGGPGAVVVKVAKQNHDMRFDIPVMGLRTMKVLKKAGISALAVEARRTILLERDKLVEAANRLNLALVAVEVKDHE